MGASWLNIVVKGDILKDISLLFKAGASGSSSEMNMGLAGLFTSALKDAPWQKIATMAMEYAPEIYRRASEMLRRDVAGPQREQAEAELKARVESLEKLLLEQEEIIRGQEERCAQLSDACLQLESRLRNFRIICAVLAVSCVILAFLVFRQG